MPATDDDWRLQGQDNYLTGVTLQWREWTPPLTKGRAWRIEAGGVMESRSPDAEPPKGALEEVEPRGWDHDHCDFCWATFVAADHPGIQASRDAGNKVHTEGYTPADSKPGESQIWICRTCFEDFRQRFQWAVTPTDP